MTDSRSITPYQLAIEKKNQELATFLKKSEGKIQLLGELLQRFQLFPPKKRVDKKKFE